ncbi:MAG TPA: proline dehydrogenase family protein [Nitrospiria bacterium]|nr:proline dehydrogenase family protein [Nitrospiria bacterium]
MFKRLLLALSDSTWARRAVTHSPLGRMMASRFVAGESLNEAVAVIRRLNAQRLAATIDHLGEHVRSPADAIRAADGTLSILDRIVAERLDANLSIKLTQFGLDLEEPLCLELLRRVLKRAAERGVFVRIDMEDSRYTDRTLALCRTLNREWGPDRVGVVIQAYLHRSGDDVRALISERIRVRLCKGAYLEPPTIAFPRKQDVDDQYIRLSRLLLESAAQGLVHAIATHDERMIAAVIDHAARLRLPAERFEFQMLYGIRRTLQQRLADQGYRVRIYLPFGTEWYPYLMRRMAERPANVWFVVKQLLRR